MIPEIGHFALVLAFAISLVQSTLPLAGAARGIASWTALARPAALAQALLLVVAFAALTHAYVTSDFSVTNVVANSHSEKPMLYKVSGVWGNHEGSMLLWVLILALCGGAVAAFGRTLPHSFQARVLAVQGMVGAAFLAFLLFSSNPFLRMHPAPADGQGLNPLLQDPGLAFHPPFLYLGYVGLSIAYAFAVAALLEGRIDAAWARWVRPWTLAAWSFLTLGIALGSWWAYYELGWGGWWYWDPVENASFMPWLAATALLHSAIVVEKRDALKAWTVLLAILAFGLSLLGTFLVRSGVLTSVHAFAVDPTRGLFILIILLAAVVLPLVLYAMRAPALAPGGLFAPVSREGALVVNNILLATACATVLVGTLYPLLLDVIGGGLVSVGPPFFNATVVPLLAPLAALAAIGPLLAWKRADLAGALGRLWMAAALAGLVAVVTLAVQFGDSIFAALGFALATWLICGSLADLADRVRLFRAPAGETGRRAAGLPRSVWGTAMAHVGVGILIVGITGSSTGQVESIQVQRPGESVHVAGYDYRLERVQAIEGPNYTAEQAVIAVSRHGRPIAELTPERRFYPVPGMPTTEAAIHTRWLVDLYTVLGDPDSSGGWVTRIYHEPLVPWIWIGCLLMTAGGGLSLSDRRLRVGAPRRSRGSHQGGQGASPWPAPDPTSPDPTSPGPAAPAAARTANG